MTRTTQSGWHCCRKCGGLFFTPAYHGIASANLACKGGGVHNFRGTTNRMLAKVDPPAPENAAQGREQVWRFCANCHGLFRLTGDADHVSHGVCNHARAGTTAHVVAPNSAFYILEPQKGTLPAARQASAYYACANCGGLFHDWAGGTSCNASGHHTRATIDLSGWFSGGWYYELRKAQQEAQRQHTVNAHDALSLIAVKYETTVDQIVADNKAKYPKITSEYIQVGWVLDV